MWLASYTPNASSYGTYAFEDFWPKKGDYDFNDFVIGYNYEVARNASNDIWVEMNLRLKALGAGFQSGFGISLDGVPSSAISSVTLHQHHQPRGQWTRWTDRCGHRGL